MATSLHDPLVVPMTVNLDVGKILTINKTEDSIPVQVSTPKPIEISTATPKSFNVAIEGNIKQYPVSVSTSINIHGDYDWYEGIYTVIPSTKAAKTLTTKYKLMRDNVKVEKVPYYETSNLSGGHTVYIGNEVEINGN